MPDFDPQQLSVLSAQIEGLEAAVEGLAADPSVGISIRRIARSLQSAAQSVGATEIAAGADAIQKASDAQLDRSVGNFLDRIEDSTIAPPLPGFGCLYAADQKASFRRGFLRLVAFIKSEQHHKVDLDDVRDERVLG